MFAAFIAAGPPSPASDSSSDSRLLVVGMSTHIALSVLGFVIMVAAAVTAIYSWQHVGSGPDPRKNAPRPRAPQSSGSGDGQGFMDKMEERWKRRRDESGF